MKRPRWQFRDPLIDGSGWRVCSPGGRALAFAGCFQADVEPSGWWRNFGGTTSDTNAVFSERPRGLHVVCNHRCAIGVSQTTNGVFPFRPRPVVRRDRCVWRKSPASGRSREVNPAHDKRRLSGPACRARNGVDWRVAFRPPAAGEWPVPAGAAVHKPVTEWLELVATGQGLVRPRTAATSSWPSRTCRTGVDQNTPSARRAVCSVIEELIWRIGRLLPVEVAWLVCARPDAGAARRQNASTVGHRLSRPTASSTPIQPSKNSSKRGSSPSGGQSHGFGRP